MDLLRTIERPRAAALLAAAAVAGAALARCAAQPTVAGDPHAAWEALLARYVTDEGVRYPAWAGTPADRQALSAYVDGLEAIDPSALSREAALAYWLNLYNAAAVELVLAHYPVKSVRDIGGPEGSPFKRSVVTVAGRAYSLDAIEHDVLRPAFQDARIHCALNCAAVGCPPLVRHAFSATTLDQQLEDACRRVVGDSRWVELRGRRIRLTKLFDWYAADFEHEGSSVRRFLARYRPADAAALLDEDRRVEYREYDWRLNQVPPVH